MYCTLEIGRISSVVPGSLTSSPQVGTYLSPRMLLKYLARAGGQVPLYVVERHSILSPYNSGVP